MVAHAFLAAALLATSATAGALSAEREPWLTDLRFPVNMAWAPDGTLFFAEKELGNVRMVVDGQLASAPVAHVDVTVSFETGLLGLAVDPRWPVEPWLYLYYSDPRDGRNRLIRIRIEDGREVDRETLLDGLPTAAAYHNGGEMVFGPDGMLYLAVGDAHESDRAQDPSDLGGKILRLAPDGEIPVDNPIAGTRTFTLGHRNAFGLCVDPATGDVWETENGEPVEELNRLVAGGNYGWPVGQGSLADDRFRDPVVTLNEAAPTGCAVWRGAVYFGTYTRGELLRWPLDRAGRRVDVVSRFGGPVYDVSVAPDDRLYVSTGDTIWKLDGPPDPAGAIGPGDAGGDPGGSAWWYVAVGIVLAASLAVTLRLSARRR